MAALKLNHRMFDFNFGHQLAVGHLQVEESQRPYMCMDLSFLHTLLTKGFKVRGPPGMLTVVLSCPVIISGPKKPVQPLLLHGVVTLRSSGWMRRCRRMRRSRS